MRIKGELTMLIIVHLGGVFYVTKALALCSEGLRGGRTVHLEGSNYSGRRSTYNK